MRASRFFGRPKMRKGSYFPVFLEPRRMPPGREGARRGGAGGLCAWRLDPLGSISSKQWA
jgi:hypothetical protein